MVATCIYAHVCIWALNYLLFLQLERCLSHGATRLLGTKHTHTHTHTHTCAYAIVKLLVSVADGQSSPPLSLHERPVCQNLCVAHTLHVSSQLRDTVVTCREWKFLICGPDFKPLLVCMRLFVCWYVCLCLCVCVCMCVIVHVCVCVCVCVCCQITQQLI